MVNVSSSRSRSWDTKRLVGLALFTAIIVVLQFLGSFIRFGAFSVSLVLIPMVVGSALYGWASGAWLGFVFGIVVLISGDAASFLGVNALGTVVTVLVKGVLAGMAAGFVYAKLREKSEIAAIIAAAVVCPVVNTGVFLLGCVVFFMDTVAGWAQAMGFGSNVAGYMFLGLAGGNFLFEMLFNIVLSPLIVRLIRIGKKM